MVIRISDKTQNYSKVTKLLVKPKHSFIFDWTQKTRKKIYLLCYIYCLYIFLIRIALTDVFPIDVSIASPLAGTDLLLCALFGCMICGLAIRFGGAMDGIEVMTVIFSKQLGKMVGTFVMIYNVILYMFVALY